MRIMGIDCSTQSFAYCVIDDGVPVHWGEYSFGKGDLLHRMNNANRTSQAISELPDFQDIDHVVMEAAVFMNNRQTVIALSYLFGAAVSPFVLPGRKAEKIPPITWQRGIGNPPLTAAEKKKIKEDNPGKSKSWYSNAGREFRKERTKQIVLDKYGIKTDSDNISDAIGIAAYVSERDAK